MKFEVEVNELYKQIKNKYANMLAVVLSIAIVFSLFSFPLVPTASAAGPLPAPQNVQVTGVTHQSITLEWEPVVGVDQDSGYQVWYSNGGWAAWVGTSTVTVRGLNSNTNYSFYVTAISAANDRSVIVTATTDAVPSTPQVTSVSVPANGTYTSGQALDFMVNFDQAVVVDTSSGTPNLTLVVGFVTRRANYVSGSGTNALTFRYTVQSGDSDSNGITVGPLSLNGGTIKDSSYGTDASLTLNNVGNTAGVLIGAPFEAATVSTNPVTNITSTSAEVGGNVTNDGGAVVTVRGIVYSTSSNPTITDMKVVVAGTTGSYPANLTGLTAGTTYHIRAFATNSVGTSYGNDVSFTTTLPSSIATVSTTDPVTNVTSTSADVGGYVTSEGGAPVTVRGVVYSTSSDPTIADRQIVIAGTIGSYTSNLTGLVAGTTYHVRAFATNNVGTSYGNDVSFTTLSTTPPIATVIGMSLNKHTGTMQVGDTFTVVATATMSDTTTQDVTSLMTWTADDPSKVTIHNGVITALQSGTVKVQATYSGTSVISDYVVLNITNPTSSNSNIPSSPNITTPSIPVTSVTVNSTSDSVYKGSTLSLVAVVLPNSATNSLVVWTVNPGTGMATISPSGLLKGIANGTVTVVATSMDGTQIYGSKVITVNELPASPTSAFTTVINIAKITSEITKKLEDSKGEPAKFNDTDSHWADKTVKLFTKLGVVKGYEDGSFGPNNSITRGEFATIIYRVFGLAGSTSTELSDVKGHWAEEAIVALSSNGIIAGYEDGTFKPDRPITRAEIISIISKLVVLKTTTSQDAFKDIDGIWNKDQIKEAASMGLVNGQSIDHFAPQSNATRAEALTMILHVLELDSSLKSLFE